MGRDWNKCQSSNIWGVFLMNRVQMMPRVAGAIRSLVNARGLQLECVRVLHEGLLLYGSEIKIGRKKERSRIRTVQVDNVRGLLGIREWIEYRMRST